jgi:hypothetical protein
MPYIDNQWHSWIGPPTLGCDHDPHNRRRWIQAPVSPSHEVFVALVLGGRPQSELLEDCDHENEF